MPILPKSQLEIMKAKLCGFLASDGSVLIRKEKNGKVHHEVMFYPDHVGLVKEIVSIFMDVYGKKLHERKYNGYYYLRTSSKDIVLDLLKLGKFTSRNWTLPKILNNKACKKAWLSAYFDGDGYVCKNYVQVQSVNKDGIIEIQRLLLEFGISSKLYKYKRKQVNWSINYILTIPKRDMIKFFKEIGFNHPDKSDKLRRFVDADIA